MLKLNVSSGIYFQIIWDKWPRWLISVYSDLGIETMDSEVLIAMKFVSLGNKLSDYMRSSKSDGENLSVRLPLMHSASGCTVGKWGN